MTARDGDDPANDMPFGAHAELVMPVVERRRQQLGLDTLAI